MSRWLENGEVLVGQGLAEPVPPSPRLRAPQVSSPRLRNPPVSSPRLRNPPVSSPRLRWTPQLQQMPLSPQEELMGKAKELFELCDKEGKGFITKRDMQRLEGEVPLSPEQLETVFESLDREGNGFLTPLEFSTGLGEQMMLEQTMEDTDPEQDDGAQHRDNSQDPAALRFANMLSELGADKLFKSHAELCGLWCELERESPALLALLEEVLAQALSHLQDAIRERDGLEQALRRREAEHDKAVRSIYEEMENQVREERERHLAQDNVKQRQKDQHLEEQLKIREQELELTLSKLKEMESRLFQLSCEHLKVKEQNQQLHRVNVELQEQLESSHQQLQTALKQLSVLQERADLETQAKQRNVLKVSRNMQKEKDSLMKQLELLRDMNKRLRDEKDARLESQRRPAHESKILQKKGSIIGDYLLPEKKKRMSLELDLHNATKMSSTLMSSVHSTTQGRDLHPQSVFKVVFLGNSGVGKSSFIQHFCTGRFTKKTATVGMDFQMKTFTVKSRIVTLQLWDTVGQERFRSVTEQYYRKADGILAMYDVADPYSFTAVQGWISSVKEKMCEEIVLMILGNKLDLTDGETRAVGAEEGHRLAQQQKALFYECSAKTGLNLNESMSHMAELLMAQNRQQRGTAISLSLDAPKNRCCA